MSTELKEGQRGSGTSLYYPRVSSCLTVSCVCSGVIYGMHGVQQPEGDQRSMQEMVVWLKESIKSLKRDKLIIACDLNVYQTDGRGIARFTGRTDFDELAEYLGFTGKGIEEAGTHGDSTLVHVGGGSKYFNKKSSSAYFTVDASGQVL